MTCKRVPVARRGSLRACLLSRFICWRHKRCWPVWPAANGWCHLLSCRRPQSVRVGACQVFRSQPLDNSDSHEPRVSCRQQIVVRARESGLSGHAGPGGTRTGDREVQAAAVHMFGLRTRMCMRTCHAGHPQGWHRWGSRLPCWPVSQAPLPGYVYIQTQCFMHVGTVLPCS